MHLARQMLSLLFLNCLQMIGEHSESCRAFTHLPLQTIALDGEHPTLRLCSCIEFFGLT